MPRRHLLPCLLALALLGPASQAGAADKSIWGPTHFHVGHADCPGPSRCSTFPLYRALGVDNYQMQVRWDRVAPTQPANPRDPNDPAYKWPTDAEFVVPEAAAYGISVAILVQGSPPWANGGQDWKYAPNRAQDYADFMYAISKRYPSVRRWMIWGEPMWGYTFAPMPPNSRVGPRQYAKILDRAYKALKQASKGNIVIGGMTMTGGGAPVSVPKFIRWMRVGKGKKSRPPRMDWWGHNPFDGRFPRIKDKPQGNRRGLNDIDTLYREIQRAFGKGKKGKKGKKAVAAKKGKKVPKLWLSEWLVQSDRPSGVFTFYVSREDQARYITAAYRLVNRLKYVKGLGWFKLDDSNEPGTGPTWGLMTYEGQRKPAFGAYAAAP